MAALLAIVLGPVVDLTERRLHLRRSLATVLVFLVVAAAFAGMLTVFIRPLVTEGGQLADRAPAYIEQARAGRGPVGGLVKRYRLDQYVERNQARLREAGSRITTPAIGALRSLFSTLIAPYKGVVALFVGFADLIPLVGATLGAIVAVVVAALHSLPAAIVTIVFFIVYQQAENHLLQPVIMSRTVALSALTVLISVLVGVELLGFLGALLAIPVAGVISVIGRDLYDSYRGRLKPEPTIGEDEIPATSSAAPLERE